MPPLLDPALHVTLRIALALLLLSAARHKLAAPAAFRDAIADYRLVPGWATTATAVALVAAELGIGAALLVPVPVPVPGLGLGAAAGLATGALLALYTGAIAVNLRRGRRGMDCGCSGPGARRELDSGLVVRNVILIGAAALCSLSVPVRPWIWLDTATVAGGVAVSGLLYAAIDRALTTGAGLRAMRGDA